MQLRSTKLKEVLLLEPRVFGDVRGYFMETYNREAFAQLGLHYDFVQDNQSLSGEAGVLRGLHYQLHPKAQSKLVRVLSGAIYDVAVDIRKSSSTFGQWVGMILSEENKKQLFIPKGFAHGFCTLEPDTSVLYKVDEYYCPENERGILWNDPALTINWPTQQPILSEKDRLNPPLKQAEINFE